MQKKHYTYLLPTTFCLLLLLSSCGSNYTPQKTYPIELLRQDFRLMRLALESYHPGIYRYTSPDSMQWIFDQTAQQLTHDMTEQEFRRTLNPIFSYIRCGHTNIYSSNQYTKYLKRNKPKEQTLSIIYLQNRLVIAQNRSKDTLLKAGARIVAVNDKPISVVIDEMRRLIPSDGYNQTFKNVVLSNQFGDMYRYWSGRKDSIKLSVQLPTGLTHTTMLALHPPVKDSSKTSKIATSTNRTSDSLKVAAKIPKPKTIKHNKRRSLIISEKDSTVAILDINTFGRYTYQSFNRQAFRFLKNNNIQHLIIDLRSNGGGRSDASTDLMRYLLKERFVVYDTIDSKKGKPSFNRYYGNKFFRFVSRNVFSKKLPSGHLRHRAAGRVIRPNKRLQFGGKVYLLTNGGAFSAAAIFASMVRQYNPNATVIGRETGGGRHGCNAFISPYLQLPHTKVKVRIPMYKIVLHVPGNDQGRGVMPDYPVEHTFDDVRKNRDADVEKAYELIKTNSVAIP
ncbi:MAG: S41 family peptidase [Runella sp.]